MCTLYATSCTPKMNCLVGNSFFFLVHWRHWLAMSCNWVCRHQSTIKVHIYTDTHAPAKVRLSCINTLVSYKASCNQIHRDTAKLVSENKEPISNYPNDIQVNSNKMMFSEHSLCEIRWLVSEKHELSTVHAATFVFVIVYFVYYIVICICCHTSKTALKTVTYECNSIVMLV